jgi:hypothetical protein
MDHASIDAASEHLLADYAGYLLAEDAPWRERRDNLRMARQFLAWVSSRDRGVADKLSAATATGNDEALWEIRERYLRFSCEDRELRAAGRAQLNHFLLYWRSGRR